MYVWYRKMGLESLSPFQLAHLYFGDKIPAGIKLSKEKLIEMIKSKNIAKVAVESTKDTKWREKAEKEIKKNDHRTEEQKNAHKEGTFKKSAGEIERQLMKETKNDAGKATQKCNYYLNRGGRNAENKHEVKKAMDSLQKKNEKKKSESRFSTKANELQLDLQFVPVSKKDTGFQNYKMYYNNEFVQHPDIQKRFEDFMKKRIGSLDIVNHQYSTSKIAPLSADVESFFEDTFGRPFKTYIGDGQWGIWISQLNLNNKPACILQCEEPKSPFSRVICLSDNTQLKMLNKMLVDWKSNLVPSSVEQAVVAKTVNSKQNYERKMKMKVLSKTQKYKVKAGKVDFKGLLGMIEEISDNRYGAADFRKLIADWFDDLIVDGISPCDENGKCLGVYDICYDEDDVEHQYEAGRNSIIGLKDYFSRICNGIRLLDKHLLPLIESTAKNMDKAEDELYDQKEEFEEHLGE